MDWLIKKLPLIIGFLLVVSTFYFFSNIWFYIILAAIISLLGRPLVQLLIKIKIKKFKISKGIAAGISLLAFWMFFYLFLRIFVPLIVNEANELSKINTSAIQTHFQEPLSELQCTLENIIIEKEDFDLKAYVQEKLTTVLNLAHLKGFFSNIIGTVGDIFIAIFAISFISFFFLKDDRLLMRGILSLVSVDKEEQVKHVVLKVIKLLSRYFGGLLLEVTAIIILVTLGLWAMGIGFTHAIVIGLVAGFLNVIPYVGPLIGMAFGTVIAIATELTDTIPDNLLWLFIGIIAVFLIVQLIDNFVLQTLIYSSSVNASPLEIFLVILIAGTVGGIGGMILAIPIYTILRVIAKETLSQFKFVEKLTKDI
jgi:predicted PurR-regulated permease PerM